VIKYSYLWRSEAKLGRTEGRKDRPCAIVLAVKSVAGKTVAVVAPVTHSPSLAADGAIELPASTKARLGLDHARSWIITNDLNYFTWPGPDIRPIDSMRGIAYGYLPAALTKRLVESVREQIRTGKEKLVKREP
jgi:hypothetical protein